MRVINGVTVYEGSERLKERVLRIKACLTVPQVLQAFGIYMQEDFGGRVQCPFHGDANPSAKLFDDGQVLHCFAGQCAFHGDVIDVAQRASGQNVISTVGFLEAQFDLWKEALPEVPTGISLHGFRSQCEEAVLRYYETIRDRLSDRWKGPFQESFEEAFSQRHELSAWNKRGFAENGKEVSQIQLWLKGIRDDLYKWEQILKSEQVAPSGEP